MTTIIFRRSDAVCENFDVGPVEDEHIVIEGDVQLTYETLRDTETSNTIAHLDRTSDTWMIESNLKVNDYGPYSDVIIIAKEG